MWSVGTIFVELVWRAPYLPGNSDVDQMKRIMQMMGSPDEATWPVSPALRLRTQPRSVTFANDRDTKTCLITTTCPATPRRSGGRSSRRSERMR
jgi:hypothetical protein